MSTQSNLQLVKDFFLAMDSGKVDQISNFLAPNAEFNILGMEPMKGIQDIQKGFESWSRAFPDLKSQILNTIVSEDWVVVEYLSRGTHEGPLEGEDGNVLQPTHRKIEVPADKINLEFVLGNKVMVGTVNASPNDFRTGVDDLIKAEAIFPGWLKQLLTHPVKGLDNYAELFDKLLNAKGAIKIFCEVADL